MLLSFFLAILNFGYFTIFGRYLRRFAFFFSTLANMCLSCRLYSWLLAPLLEICILHLNVVLFFFFFFCLNKTFCSSLYIKHACFTGSPPLLPKPTTTTTPISSAPWSQTSNPTLATTLFSHGSGMPLSFFVGSSFNGFKK